VFDKTLLIVVGALLTVCGGAISIGVLVGAPGLPAVILVVALGLIVFGVLLGWKGLHIRPQDAPTSGAAGFPVAVMPVAAEPYVEPPESITLQFELTPTDLAEAARVPAATATVVSSSPPGPVRGSAIRRGIAGWALFIFLAVLLVVLTRRRNQPASATLTGPQASERGESSVTTGTVVAMTVGGTGAGMFAAGLWLVARRGRHPLPPGGLLTASVSKGGVEYRMPGYEEHLLWTCFVGTAETDRLLLLHEEESRFRAFPKRAFADERQVAAFRRLVRNSLDVARGGQVNETRV
jgi:hypothetical protein